MNVTCPDLSGDERSDNSPAYAEKFDIANFVISYQPSIEDSSEGGGTEHTHTTELIAKTKEPLGEWS